MTVFQITLLTHRPRLFTSSRTPLGNPCATTWNHHHDDEWTEGETNERRREKECERGSKNTRRIVCISFLFSIFSIFLFSFCSGEHWHAGTTSPAPDSFRQHFRLRSVSRFRGTEVNTMLWPCAIDRACSIDPFTAADELRLNGSSPRNRSIAIYESTTDARPRHERSHSTHVFAWIHICVCVCYQRRPGELPRANRYVCSHRRVHCSPETSVLIACISKIF